MKYSLRSLMTFSIRDLALVTVIVALAVGWWVEHRERVKAQVAFTSAFEWRTPDLLIERDRARNQYLKYHAEKVPMNFSIRDWLGLTVVVALAVGWWLDHRRLTKPQLPMQTKTIAPDTN